MPRGILVVIGALLLAGCTSAAPAAAPPPGVSVSVFQTRSDYADRALEIRVTNESDATLTVTSAAFESTRFVATSSWDRAQQIPAGSARDLRVLLTEPVCEPESLVDEVLVEYLLDDGSTGEARLPLVDVSTIDAISAEDCLVESIATVVQIAAADRLVWTPGASLPAILDLELSPTGEPGSVTIQTVFGTVLFGLVDDEGSAITEQAEQVTIDATSPEVFMRLRLVPNRCDPHAVAEDRRGTFFPLQVATDDGREGRIVVPVSDEVRAELYDFFSDYCALPAI